MNTKRTQRTTRIIKVPKSEELISETEGDIVS
jgi:hypothetical protein